MPRAKAPPRVKGPYSERGGTRFRIRIFDVTEHRDLYFSTVQEARAGMKEAAREFPQAGNGRALGKTLDEYIDDKVKRGLCTARSASRRRNHLRTWLFDYLDKDIDKLTSKRATALYERLVSTPTGKTGRPPSAATPRYYLQLAQMLFRWAIRKGFLRESPFATVQPGVLDGARTERLAQMLALDPTKPSLAPPAPSAEQFLASLPYETLARLVALADQTSGRKA